MSIGYTLRAKGTYDSENGTSLSPSAPAGVQVGDLLLLAAWTRNQVANSMTIPSGWTQLSPGTNVTWNYLLGRIADGTSANTPTLTYAVSAHCGAQICAFYNNVYSAIGSIVDSSADMYLPANQTTINYPALAPIQNNCLIIYFGTKNKTTASDSTTINNLSGVTKIDTHVNNGSDISEWWGYQQQTTATNLAAVSQTFTGTTETLQYTGIVVGLKSAPTTPAGALSYNLLMQV